MLPAKPWKPDAIIRLLASVFLCMFGGSVLTTLVYHLQAPGPPDSRVLLPGVMAIACVGATLAALRLPWAVETFLRRLLMAIGAFYASFFLWLWLHKQVGGQTVVSVHHMIIAAVSFQGATLVLLLGFLREHDMNFAEAFGFKKEWPAALMKGVILACLFLPVGWALQYGSVEFLERMPGQSQPPEEQQAVTTLRMATSWGDRVALGAITILLAPLAEEFLFRGVLYSWIRQLGFRRVGLWVTSLLFAAFHLNVATFLPLLLLSILLALLYERTGNLLAPIIAHSVFNAFNFTAVFVIQKFSPVP